MAATANALLLKQLTPDRHTRPQWHVVAIRHQRKRRVDYSCACGRDYQVGAGGLAYMAVDSTQLAELYGGRKVCGMCKRKAPVGATAWPEGLPQPTATGVAA